MSKQIEIIPEFNNFRDLLENSVDNFGSNIAYKYKKNINKKPVEYVEKTYKNEYGWGVFEANVPVDVTNLSDETEELLVLTFEDFEETFPKCIPVGRDYYELIPLWQRGFGRLLRIFGPIL